MERKKLATYTNHAGPLIDKLIAALFSEETSVDDPPERVSELMIGADGRGTPWDRWWAAATLGALIGRQSWAWVNLPARTEDTIEPTSLRDEEQAGLLESFLVLLEPEQVLDWIEDDRGRVTGIMIRWMTSSREGPDSPRLPVYQWTWIDSTRIRRWEWKPPEATPDREPTDSEDAGELPEIVHKFGRLPVARLQFPHGLWAMEKIHDPAVTLLRARNDLSWALHRAANALLVIKSKWQGAAPVLGHGYYLQLHRDKQGEDSAEYVEPSGKSFDLLAKDVQALRDDLYRVVDQLAASADSDSTQAPKSGESKRQDWKSLDLILSAYAAIVRSAMEETLQIVAGVDADPITVNGLDAWNLEDLAEFLENALGAEVLIPSETYKKVIAKRAMRRILGDESDEDTLRTIEKEIDAHDFEPPDIMRNLPGMPGKNDDDDDEGDED